MAEVTRAVAHGLPVMHGDADIDLAHYPDGAFDYVVLSRALQAVERPREVLAQMLRIGTRAMVSFPEFRPLAGALATARERPDADDLDLGPSLVRDAQHPSLHDPRLFRSVRAGGLHRRAVAGGRRWRSARALASLFADGQPVRGAGAVPAAPEIEAHAWRDRDRRR